MLIGIPDPTQIIQPWQHGHGETKATCLWLKNLVPLRPSRIVPGREQRVFRMAPGPERKRERSRTFNGIAEAMALQWGGDAIAAGAGTAETGTGSVRSTPERNRPSTPIIET
jgi:hypothetical protein